MAWEVSDGPSSLQLCWQPEAQSDGSANEGRSMEFSVEALLAFVHCQRTPRSPGKEPRSLSRALVGVGRAGAVSFGREYRRQCTPLDWIATTWHGTPAISMESAPGSEPNPVPATVISVPPANEPNCGVTEVMRGGISASNVSPVATSTSFVVRKPRYALPR